MAVLFKTLKKVHNYLLKVINDPLIIFNRVQITKYIYIYMQKKEIYLDRKSKFDSARTVQISLESK